MGDSFLERAIDDIRLWTNEPSLNAKYTDAVLIRMIEQQWANILAEMNRNAQNPIFVRHDLTFEADVDWLQLPPTVGTIIQLAGLSTSGEVEWYIQPRSRYNPLGPGVSFEGHAVRIDPSWVGTSQTVRMTYVPTGAVKLHRGTLEAFDNTTTTGQASCTLMASPTSGSLDKRPNAYAGSVIRLLTSTDAVPADVESYVEERVIQSYDVATRIAIVKPEFAYDRAAATIITYEIAPLLYQAQDVAVSLAVAMTILAVEGDKRYGVLERQYARQMRELRLQAATWETIVGTRFEHDTQHNTRYLSW